MAQRIRGMLRWLHIVLGLVIMCYIYSPFHQYAWFQITVKFFVIPVITLSGVWLWRFSQVNKRLGIR
ncbi:MAG: hypothetical protein Q8Q08_01415 [Candidatus Omnitrophota bacterium]|nr:hypothetical protein [Candidatus Omnitrophota bacterium]MDZ4243389.1 hypothetical protein [Candidatus Omnitrophota bacterium]